MKTVGIVAEYNPFHNGHKYQIAKAKEYSKAECTAVVMSGNFTQRGDIALSNKWVRAQNAVKAGEEDGIGADLVLELPFAFACNRAEIFARGGVDTLVGIGVDSMSFGCEADREEDLIQLAEDTITKKITLNTLTMEFMEEGVSRARAYHRAVAELLGEEKANLIESPNNILAIEYLKRLYFWQERGVMIKPVVVKRYGSGYRGVDDLHQGYEKNLSFAGATMLREMLRFGEDISRYIPVEGEYEDMDEIERNYFNILRMLVVRSGQEDLEKIYCVGEGIENKILKEIVKASDYQDYVDRMVSKRYTASAITRIFTYIILGIKGLEMDKLMETPISCARVLAAGPKGRELIRWLDNSDFDVVTNINKDMHKTDKTTWKLLQMDVHVSDIYNLICGKDLYRYSDRTVRPYIV